MKQILWVDDEIDLLRAHLIYLGERGYEVTSVTNGSDAIELVKSRPFDLALIDEMMPGMDGLETLQGIKRIRPDIPAVMVTKNEEEDLMDQAIGSQIDGYLIKPVNPLQILSTVKRLIDKRQISTTHLSQRWTSEFADLSDMVESDLDAEGWLDLHNRLCVWEIEMDQYGEAGLGDMLQELRSDADARFANWVEDNYKQWIASYGGKRPALSMDVVDKWLVPLLNEGTPTLFLVVDCFRLDQWLMLEPLLSEYFDISRDGYHSILPTATPYARNAIFSGQYPDEIAKKRPEWWDSSDDEGSLNAFEDKLLREQLRRLTGRDVPVHYDKIFSDRQGEHVRARVNSALKTPGSVIALVFNFVDLMTHGRSESPILMEVARDEAALRSLTRAWFERSTAYQVLVEAASRGHKVILTTDHGSILCQHPTTVFARKDATSNLRYKFGQELRAEVASAAFSTRDEKHLRLPAGRLGMTYLLALDDFFFVYPTKLREYQARYKNSFLHGGISPEEMIVPVASLTPRR